MPFTRRSSSSSRLNNVNNKEETMSSKNNEEGELKEASSISIHEKEDSIAVVTPSSSSATTTTSSSSSSSSLSSSTPKKRNREKGNVVVVENSSHASADTTTLPTPAAIQTTTTTIAKKGKDNDQREEIISETTTTTTDITNDEVTKKDRDHSTTMNMGRSSSSPPPSKRKKSTDHQRITEREELPKLWNDEMAKANGSYTFRIASWNVAGLRALVKKSPTALVDLCQQYKLDVLCLQETKLQEIHLDDPKINLETNLLMKEHGYEDYWSCSTTKKGYSGTAVFVKKRKGTSSSSKSPNEDNVGNNGNKNGGTQTKIGSFFAPSNNHSAKIQEAESALSDDTADLVVDSNLLIPTAVTDQLGQEEIDNEGRSIIMEFPWATIANVYIPNSGQKLERLDFRTQQWDKFFLHYMQNKQKDRNLPVLWLGDLNVAHQANDIWNDGAKHLDKQAGVTPQERASFTEQLEAGFVDAFRRLHPTARGHYSYWSQRAGNRQSNKGLRLDYFVCSPEFFSEDSKVMARDCYMVPDQLGSDHCPVVLELEIKP